MKVRPPDSAGDTSFAARAADTYGPDLCWFLLSRLRNPDDARDLAQEVYMRLLRLGKGELVRQPHAYVYFVANQVLAQFRLRARQNPVVYDSTLAQHRDQQPDHTDLQQDGVVDRFLAASEIEHLLAGLPSRKRQVFMMRVLEGYSWLEIAERLGISVNTVKKHLCEANAQISVMNRQQSGRHP